jgi:hypothetical protein
MYRRLKRGESRPPSVHHLKVAAERAYAEFKEMEQRLEYLEAAWMDAQANYEFHVNGVGDCLERVLRKYPDKIESTDFLEEIDAYRRLSVFHKHLLETKLSEQIFMQRMVDALQKFKEIQRLITRQSDATKLDTMIALLEEAIKIESQDDPLIGDDLKIRYLDNAIYARFRIMLHIDGTNTTGFRNNVLNVVVLGINLYKKLYPRGGRLSPKRLLEFKDFMYKANDRSGCIDLRIEELSSFIFKGDYAVDINAPFITNLSYIVTRKLREKCKKEGVQKVRDREFIKQLSQDRDFRNFISAVNKRRYGWVDDELLAAGIDLRSPDEFRDDQTWSKGWEIILVPLFDYLSTLGIIEIVDGFVDCPQAVQDQQQQG